MHSFCSSSEHWHDFQLLLSGNSQINRTSYMFPTIVRTSFLCILEISAVPCNTEGMFCFHSSWIDPFCTANYILISKIAYIANYLRLVNTHLDACTVSYTWWSWASPSWNCYAGLVGLQSPSSAWHISDPHRRGKMLEAIVQPAEKQLYQPEGCMQCSQMLMSIEKSRLALIGEGESTWVPPYSWSDSEQSINGDRAWYSVP